MIIEVISCYIPTYHRGDTVAQHLLFMEVIPVTIPIDKLNYTQVPTQLPTSFHLASPNATSTAFGTTVGGASKAGEAPNT